MNATPGASLSRSAAESGKTIGTNQAEQAVLDFFFHYTQKLLQLTTHTQLTTHVYSKVHTRTRTHTRMHARTHSSACRTHGSGTLIPTLVTPRTFPATAPPTSLL